MCNANAGKIGPNLVAGGGSGKRGVGYTGLTIVDAPLSFINGVTRGKSPSSNGGYGSGEKVVVTLVREYLIPIKKGTAGGGGSYNL